MTNSRRFWAIAFVLSSTFFLISRYVAGDRLARAQKCQQQGAILVKIVDPHSGQPRWQCIEAVETFTLVNDGSTVRIHSRYGVLSP